MMLFKLSIKNIQKSIKDYVIYFFTLILGVAIFYVFNAIESQSVMMSVSSNTMKIIDLMTRLLSGVSVFVSIILGFLLLYANRFIMKRRNKEFGIYLTLGMSKQKISKILLLETFLIGCISLTIGLIVGILLSQMMSILVANMFEADMTSFSFVVSSSAIFKTIVYFGVMYVLVMLFNTVQVGKCKLIDLLYANKKSEKVHLKNPYICVIVCFISIIMLGIAYYLVTAGLERLSDVTSIFIPIGLGAVGTFLFIWSLSGLLLKIVMSFKNIYYKGLNSFTLRQISSKINTTVMSMTIICLMLFVTICVLSSSLSIKNSMTANLKELAPVDIEMNKQLNLTEDDSQKYGYTKEQLEDSTLSLKETLQKMNFDTSQYFGDVLDFKTYETKDITIQTTLGNVYDTTKETYPFLIFDTKETFIKLSDYNKIASMYGKETFTLEENQYLVIADFEQWISIRNEALKDNTPILLSGKQYYPKYKECQDGFVHISSNHINIGIFVVPDKAIEEMLQSTNIILANYKADHKEGKKEIEQKIVDLGNHSYISNTTLNASTKLSIYEASVGLGALVTFIGLYLGIIFLLSSAAILALKELSESADNKERFLMLQKIGVDDKMLHQALFRQIFIFFLFPLLLACIHSIFGILFCNEILEVFGNEQLLKSIIMTAIFLIIIYGGYFWITYLCSKNIIKSS